MNPPYKLVDMATGQDVPNMVGMDTAVGRYIEVYSGPAAGAPDTRISDGALKRTEGVIEPPPVIPPATGGIMQKPATAEEFHGLVQTALTTGTFVVLDPLTNLTLDRPLVFDLYGGGTPHGIIGNGAKLTWAGGAEDMVTFRADKSRGVNTNLVVDNLYFFGNGYAAQPAGDCLKLHAPTGDPGSIYKFKLKDIYCNYATRGIMLEGAVFEGFLDNIHCENMRSHGMECAHTYTEGEHQGIVSNINIMHPNLSRNFGAGLKCTYSTNLLFGSFVLNALGGVVAPDGLRYAAACNGENTGEAVFVLHSQGYGSVITGCEGSSDASTHARAFEGGEWVSKGTPMLYLIDGPCDQSHNHVSYYGAGDSPMKVQK